jgi:hypothetical protein
MRSRSKFYAAKCVADLKIAIKEETDYYKRFCMREGVFAPEDVAVIKAIMQIQKHLWPEDYYSEQEI